MAGGEGPVNQDNKRQWKDEAIANVFRKTKKGKKKTDPALGNLGSAARAEVLLAPEEYVRIIPVTKDDSRAQLSDTVQLSSKDKASQMQLSPEKLGVTSHKGYRTVKATHGVYYGTWYCEIDVKHLGATGHCRLGWCTKKAELQAPVGFDSYGFSYRDIDGSKVHKSWRTEYGSSFKQGDVIGMLIHLPPGGKPMEHFHKEQVQFKGAMYYIDSPDPEPQKLPGSFVGFFKNGEWQGQAYTDLNEGTYYPSASLYTMPEQAEGATVTFNFGPDFAFPPAAVEGAPAPKPYAEVAKLPPPSRPSTPPQDAAASGAAEAAAGADAGAGAAEAGADAGAGVAAAGAGAGAGEAVQMTPSADGPAALTSEDAAAAAAGPTAAQEQQ